MSQTMKAVGYHHSRPMKIYALSADWQSAIGSKAVWYVVVLLVSLSTLTIGTTKVPVSVHCGGENFPMVHNPHR